MKKIEWGAFIYNQLNNITMEGANTTIKDNMLNEDNNLFRDAYQSGGAGTYTGTQDGEWGKQ